MIDFTDKELEKILAICKYTNNTELVIIREKIEKYFEINNI